MAVVVCTDPFSSWTAIQFRIEPLNIFLGATFNQLGLLIGADPLDDILKNFDRQGYW